MAHYVFNFSHGDRDEATALLRTKLWGIGRGEQHGDELSPGDLVLLYVAQERSFIGRAAVATGVHDWTRSDAEAYPGDSPGGVGLSRVQEWEPALSMDAVVRRVDPTGSNPLVQANAISGFRTAVVRITSDEYDAALTLSPERPRTDTDPR